MFKPGVFWAFAARPDRPAHFDSSYFVEAKGKCDAFVFSGESQGYFSSFLSTSTSSEEFR